MWEAVPIDTGEPEPDLDPTPPFDVGSVGSDAIADLLVGLDLPGGFVPDVDRDGDRIPDTVGLDWQDGIALATDTDCDGRADAVTTIDGSGRWQVFERSDGPWQAGRSGRIE